jgi:predicted PurR-regulated permease PerM
LVFVIVQSIEGYILTPIFSGKATNLGPVPIFVAVLAGASVAGLYGMLLAIPAAACAKILVRETVMPSLKRWTEGKSSDFLPLDRG